MLKKRFKQIGIDVRFIDAIKGSELPEKITTDYNSLTRQIWAREPYRVNAIGCSLSHQKAWQLLIEEGAHGAFVFEDDAVVIKAEERHITEKLRQINKNKDMFDIVFLSDRQKDSKKIPIQNSQVDVCCLKFCGVGAESYFISKIAANRLLQHPLTTVLEIDTLMHQWWVNGCKVVYVRDPLFEEDGRRSQIGYEYDNSFGNSSLWTGLLRRIQRVRSSIIKRRKFHDHVSAINHLCDFD